ncbi:MAG: hypothetical protein ACRD0Z_00040 [Acidimicrobiales bacterium]
MGDRYLESAGTAPARAPRRRALWLLAVACLAACGANTTHKATTTAAGTSATTTTATATTTTASTMPSAAKSDADIKNSYSILFDLANPAIAPKLAVVQDGQALKAAFTAALKSSLAKEAGGATVSKITLKSGSACTSEVLTSPCAAVTYNIVSPKNSVILPNGSGYAVYTAGSWLVAKSTICGLLALENNDVEPTGC